MKTSAIVHAVKRALRFLPLGVVPFVFAGAAMAAPKIERTDVFVSGTGGYHSYRIPAIVTSKKGTLLAFCEGRRDSLSDRGDIDMLLRRSFDNGKTWQPVQTIWDDGKNEIQNPCPVVDRETGAILLLFTKNVVHVYVAESADDGATWSKPREISKEVMRPDWTWFATGPGHGIQLASGRLLIPCDHRVKGLPRKDSFSHVIYSDDHGKTWKVGGSSVKKTNESIAVETVDGRVCLNMRNFYGKHCRAVAWSADGGLTWSDPVFDKGLSSPVCQASICRFTDEKRHDRNRILFSSPTGKDRERMAVRISYDECKTWSDGKVLHAGPAAYSDLCVASDMSVCCVYECGQVRPNRNRRHSAYDAIRFARFNLAWLTDGQDRLASARGGKEKTVTAAATRGSKHLLLDSRVVEKADGVRLTIGKVTKEPRNPLFKEDKPWEPRFDNLYANVIYDEDERVYKCWYSPFIIDLRTTSVPRDKRKGLNYIKVKPNDREMGVCYATSKDGLVWDKPELGIVAFKGNAKNNIVYRGPHGAGVMKDLRDPDPARRYKMFTKSGEPGKMSVAFSPDGLRWTKVAICPGIEAAGDTHNNAFWCPELNKYVGITRLWNRKSGRLVGRCESADFAKWTKAVELMCGLETERHRQTYAMPVFRYANVYLGLVMLLDTKTDLVDCELTWSPDTVHWERVCPGTPMIPRGPKGSCDWGCIYAAAYPIVRDGEIRLYYGGNNGPHTTWRDGFLCLARLRPDGFAGMKTTDADTPGTIVTKPVKCTGKRLCVSADAAGGSLRVGVVGGEGFGLGQSEPITKDVTDEAVAWETGRDLSAYVGKSIQLSFELKSACLYAFSFAGE